MNTIHGYREQDLVQNRTSVLLFGGREEDRRAWAEEAASFFAAEGPLRTIDGPDALRAQPLGKRGVVFVPDVAALGIEGQGLLVQSLTQEEKPKLILALGLPAAEAVAKGVLREDLAYRLQHARVDLSVGEVKEGIRSRRQVRAAREKQERLNAQKAALAQKSKKSKAGKATKASKPSAKPAKAAARRNTMRVKPKSAAASKAGARKSQAKRR